ncbi:hypothetical protein BFP76_08650 [Amylibacter kogurei]|uniref:Porin domain-containing protein n=2 Tax=Paramylibacter kogurei TaxID=1889778 RepID=A0A2G5K0M6_9RHOB|nr:hypothetical protein BFP76_08650 [Amylibacter kogurei]
MKKLLIASTALVATAGMASAAEVTLGGSAEMGIVDNGTNTQFHNDIDVIFTLSGETDGGLSFGATIDLDEVTNAGDDNGIPAYDNDASVWIKGGFGALTMGDTDGALDWAMTEIAMGTAIADDHTAYSAYDGFHGGNAFFDSGTILRYDNTFGDFGVAVSAQDIDQTTDAVYALGLKYGADLGGVNVGFGLGYQDAGNAGDVIGVSASTSVAGFDVVLNYADGEVGGLDFDTMGIGLGYTTGALLLHANYTKSELAGVDVDGYGLAVNYDLGGGAVVAAGYGKDDTRDTFSLGLRMDF